MAWWPTFQIGELDSVVEIFPDAVLSIMVEDALYDDDDVSCLKKLLSTSTIQLWIALLTCWVCVENRREKIIARAASGDLLTVCGPVSTPR